MLSILQAIGSIGTFIMAILYFVSVMVQIRQITNKTNQDFFYTILGLRSDYY